MKEVSNGSKINTIIFTYITMCTDEPWNLPNGKLNPSFFKIKFFLNKPDQLRNINYLYDYSLTITEKKLMTFSDFYKASDKYRIKLIDKAEKEKLNDIVIKDREEYSLADLGIN